MFEMVFLMIAVLAQGVDTGGGSTGTAMAAATEPAGVDQAQAATEEPVAPVFLAPQTPAEPIFLAPQAPAEPAFLAPTAPTQVAEPQVPTGKFTTALEVKPILNATRGNWVAVREYDGQDLVYVTHLWAWRCGLIELRIGVNGATPVPWPLPECHMEYATPNAVLDGDGLPYQPFALGSVVEIEVQITYDDLDTDSVRFDRQGVLIP